MAKQPNSDTDHRRERGGPAPAPDRDADLERREALAKLSRYATAGYVAPAFLTLMVSRKASASSHIPPPPPPP
jgi:hypothetical protein